MTREDIDFIGAMNMCDEISNEAYKKIMVHCEEEQPCTDAISRQDVLQVIESSIYDLQYPSEEKALCDDIKALPSVRVTEKTGHWIEDENKIIDEYALQEHLALVPMEDRTYREAVEIIESFPTIIEADKGESEE